MKIPRFYDNLGKYLKPNKVLLIFGPRRIGKTTLLNDFLAKCKLKYKLDSGDNVKTREILSSQDFDILKKYAAGYDLIAVDEAQRIPNVGYGFKILVDQIPNLKIIATGSSSFELLGQVGEPLTGRKTTIALYPISQLELSSLYNRHELEGQIADRLVFGGYPEVIVSEIDKNRQETIGSAISTGPSLVFGGDKKESRRKILEEIINSYLLKDILELDRVKGSKLLLDLLRLISFQVGQEVSLSELGRQLGIDRKTVGRYLDLFEKSFVLYNLRGYSRGNLRKEITKKSKYYFYDNGVRNAVISNFNELNLRDDVGVLWENFLVIERLKRNSYREIFSNNYFWRTWDQKEVDFVEERDGRLFGFELKWGSRGAAKASKNEWRAVYPEASLETVNLENFFDFIS